MDTRIKCVFLLLLGRSYASKFRPDYEWSGRAGGWLKYHAEPATWEEARRSCHDEGALLASPLTNTLESALKAFVMKNILNGLDITVFSGVHATFSNGDYSSIEGVPLLRLAITWAPGEPDNYNNSESCLAMTVDEYGFGVMADTLCDSALPYVCYKKYTEREYRFDYEWSEDAGGWLKYHVVPSTWERAKLRCHAEGAVLASPLTDQLEAAIIAFVQNQEVFHEEGVTTFTGVQKFFEGNVSSIEGVPLEQLAITWTQGELDNHDDSEKCLTMRIGFTGTVAYTRCDRVLPFVCYRKDESTDTRLNVTKCGTTDPEYHLIPKTGSCYKFHTTPLVWSEAYMTCVAEGGYLAVINDDAEASEVINDIIRKLPKSSIAADQQGLTSIGVYDWDHSGTFMTIHGETLNVKYHTWLLGEPNNGTNSGSDHPAEYCGTIERDSMGLNDYNCNVPAAFLCEMRPNSLSNDLYL